MAMIEKFRRWRRNLARVSEQQDERARARGEDVFRFEPEPPKQKPRRSLMWRITRFFLRFIISSALEPACISPPTVSPAEVRPFH
jgi:hypothetical protein